MPFKVKDLMISVPQGCQLGTGPIVCHWLNSHFCILASCGIQSFCGQCSFGSFECGGVCSFQPTVPTGYTVCKAYSPFTSAEDLAFLKQQLNKALADLEVTERALEESMRPQTVEQVEELEQKLADALEELKKRKGELQKKEGGK